LQTRQVYGGHLRFSRWPGFEHTLPAMVPAATFFASHPEWWGWDAKTGKRSADLQMCFSNTALQAFVATKVELAIDLDAACVFFVLANPIFAFTD
jgi:hypothetical protein